MTLQKEESLEDSKKEFFEKCSSILGIPHDYHSQPAIRGRKGRWNRRLGNGRFLGFGVIHFHSSTCIHCLTKVGTKTFSNPQDCLDWLSTYSS